MKTKKTILFSAVILVIFFLFPVDFAEAQQSVCKARATACDGPGDTSCCAGLECRSWEHGYMCLTASGSESSYSKEIGEICWRDDECKSVNCKIPPNSEYGSGVCASSSSVPLGDGPQHPDAPDRRFQIIGKTWVPKGAEIGLPDPDGPQGGVAVVLKTFLLWLLYILGFVSILAFIVSGFQYLLSAGDEKIIETAKRNIKWSIVGIVVALSSFIILKTIDQLLRGNTIT